MAPRGGGQTKVQSLPFDITDPDILAFHRWAVLYAGEKQSTSKRDLLPDGQRLAAAHRQAIKRLIAVDPRRALEHSVPMTLRQQLPSTILAELEERINTRIPYQVYAATSGGTNSVRRIVEAHGKRYEASVYGRRLAQSSTRQAFLVGIAVEDLMAVDERPLRIVEPGEIPDHGRPLNDVAPDRGKHSAGKNSEVSEHAQRPIAGDVPVVEAGGGSTACVVPVTSPASSRNFLPLREGPAAP